MLKLVVVQAKYGDCLILQSSDGSNSTSILIDGGPSHTYEENLKPTIKSKQHKEKKIDLAVLSHIDNDHILGLLDLFEDIKKNEDKRNKLIRILGLWHNSFGDIIGENMNNSLLTRNQFLSTPFSLFALDNDNIHLPVIGALKGVSEGRDLTKLAQSLHMPINPQFGGLLIVAGEKYENVKIGNMKFIVLGPTQKNLDKLNGLWKDWVKKNLESPTQTTDLTALQILDASISNLSSIMFVVESQGKNILFTGDGLGDDIMDMLIERGLLESNGSYHVNIMKVPHHGSERNASRKFFDSVTADIYVISANGRDDNPSLATLQWIIESKRKKNKIIRIFLTNKTDNTDKILQKYDQDKFSYQFHFLERGSHSLEIPLN